MKILVTGGGGYIAPFVTKEFRAAGHTVATTDIAYQATVDYLADLADPEQVGELLGVVKPDVICHLAAQGNVYLADENPAQATKAGPLATATLLSAVADNCPKTRVVLASTWEVYGRPVLWEPVTEMHPRTPESFYALAKNAQEEIARMFVERRGLDVVALRLGSAYGPGMRSKSVFSIFADRARQGKPISVFGDKAFRQWTHVRDVARAFRLVAERPEASGVYNAVAEDCISTLRLAKTVARLVSKDAKPVPISVEPPREGEVTPAVVSSERLQALGWMPSEDFDEALREMVEGS